MRLDLVTAIRQLRRAPGTSLAAVLTLAVGIGATTAVFSFVSAVLSTASPAPDMERLVALWSHNRRESETKGQVSPADYLEWVSRSHSFQMLAALRYQSFNVSAVGTPVRATAIAVTPTYLDLCKWRPAKGRGFIPEDVAAGAPTVLVLSHVFWQNILGGR